MRLEHLFFNLAVAIAVGMVYQWKTGRDPSVIIVVVAFLPDLDILVHAWAHLLAWFSGITILLNHGSFHNILALVLFSLGLAFIASRTGVRFLDACICIAIGYSTHLFCDAIAFNRFADLLWRLSPVVSEPIPHWYHPDLFGLAQGSVLALAVSLVLLAALVRTALEGREWVRNYTDPHFG
ncbi:MAG: metal-dependent hydrolase [Methanomicrobiales archaeon]|nr:metal-dependent hydrolase [Methanomicrobiales archaeon]